MIPAKWLNPVPKRVSNFNHHGSSIEWPIASPVALTHLDARQLSRARSTESADDVMGCMQAEIGIAWFVPFVTTFTQIPSAPI